MLIKMYSALHVSNELKSGIFLFQHIVCPKPATSSSPSLSQNFVSSSPSLEQVLIVED